MKITIGKLQSGGGLPPFVSYTPVMMNGAQGYADTSDSLDSSSRSSGSGDTKGEITNKDLLTMIKDIDGLPSDMQALYKQLSNFYTMQDYGILNTSSLSTQYLKALQQIKTAKFNKESFDSTYKKLEKDGSLNELAISATGKLIGVDSEGNIKQLGVEEARNTQEYQILTNGDLLQYRANSPNQAGNNVLQQIAANGISMDQVNQLIHNIIGTLGRTETSTEGVLSKEGQILKGIQILQQAYSREDAQGLGLDGLYDAKLITKSQATQIQAALNNIFTMLPQNAQTLLNIKTGSRENAINLVSSILTSQSSSSNSFITTLKTDNSGKKLKSDGSGVDGIDVTANVATQFIQGLGEKSSILINDGSINGLAATTSSMPVVNKEGNPLGAGSTLQDISQSQFGPILDMQQISMEGYFIPDGSTMRVLTDGQAHSIDMPIDVEALSKGQIKPDMKLFAKKEKADQYLREHNIKDINKINEYYESQGIPAKYDADGDLKSNNWRRFAAFNGAALNSAFKEDVSFSDMEEADEMETQGYLDQLRKANSWGSDNKFKFDKKSWVDKYLWDNGHDAFYKGIIYIPIKTNMFNAMSTLSGSNLLSASQATTLEAFQQQQQEKLQNYVNPGSFSVNN